MYRFQPSTTALAVAVTILSSSATAQTSTSPEEIALPEVDPRAVSIVERWVNYETDAPAFRLWVTDSMDRESEWGQRVLYTHRRVATVVRPDRMRLETRGELTNRDLIYDGSTVTVSDIDHDVYAQVPFSGTNREVIDMLLERHNMTTPLADLIGAGREAFLEDVISAQCIGQAEVSGHTCEHVAVMGEDFDWQGWFDIGPTPMLWRLVITYKNEPGTPQYVLTLQNFAVFPSVPDEQFAFTPPERATLIRFADEIVPQVAADETASPEQ